MRAFYLLAPFIVNISLGRGAALVLEDDIPSPTSKAPTVIHDDLEHGLGLYDPSPTSDNKLDKIDRSQWFQSYHVPPVRRPGSGSDSTSSRVSGDSGSLPKRVDWRDHFGVNWITMCRCGSCWAFSTTGMIESMIRIQHGTWSKRSEADIFAAFMATCATGWFPGWALELIKSNKFGLTDVKCNVYYDADRPFLGCGDRQGRTLRIGNYATIEGHEDTKWWLANIGPVTCSIMVYSDFQDWTPQQGVYRVSPDAKLEGGHALVIVGYNDDMEAYIVKNSWGPDWGDKGYVYIGFGEAGIDDVQNPRYGVTNIDPDQFARQPHRNGNIYQSADGKTHRDFEVVRRSQDGNLLQLKRQGEGRLKWSVEESITVFDFPDTDVYNNFYNQSAGPASGQPVILESSFGRQKELLYWNQEKRTFAHWVYTQVYNDIKDVASLINGDVWLQTAPGGYKNVSETEWYGNVTGYPGFTQLNNMGSDFSVVVRTGDGALTEYYRDSSRGIWQAVDPPIAVSGILQSGPALVQSNIGLDVYNDKSAGNVYVVAVLETGQLGLYWREPSGSWQEGEVFGEYITDTTPVMIQDFWDTPNEKASGGFQLLVAADDGWVENWQRTNEDILENPPVTGGPGKWNLVDSFGDGEVAYVWGLVQGSYNFALEAIVEDFSGDIWHWQYAGQWRKTKKLPS